MRLLEGASDEWEVIPEPIGKWCSIERQGDDVYQVIMRDLNVTLWTMMLLCYLSVHLLCVCLPAGIEFLSEERRKPATDVIR